MYQLRLKYNSTFIESFLYIIEDVKNHMKKFKKVYIEITNVCNLSCSFCPKTKRKPGFMSSQNFKDILEQIADYTEHIYLHILGEPLLHPELSKLLELSAHYKLKVNLTTNGTLITEKKDILLTAPALRQINFSLHSFEANSNKTSMNEYINEILDFVNEARTKTPMFLSLRLWNRDNVTSGLSGDNEMNEEVFSLIRKKLDLHCSFKERLAETGRVKLLDQVYLNLAEKFQWPDMTLEESHSKGFCYGLRDQIGVLVDGTVVPCCLDGEGVINLGNIFITPFEKILENPKAQNIYEGFSRREASEELCRKCGYRTRFGK